jgi:hypothetical protein
MSTITTVLASDLSFRTKRKGCKILHALLDRGNGPETNEPLDEDFSRGGMHYSSLGPGYSERLQYLRIIVLVRYSRLRQTSYLQFFPQQCNAFGPLNIPSSLRLVMLHLRGRLFADSQHVDGGGTCLWVGYLGLRADNTYTTDDDRS